LLLIVTGGSFWLKKWSEVNGEKGTNPNVGFYIGIYFALGIGSAALVVIQTLILWIFCSIEVSGFVAECLADANLICSATGIQEAA